MNKSQDVEAWFVGRNTFFKLHDYTKNMTGIITTFNLKGKADIWWEDVKNIKDIYEEEFTWREFETLFRKKYLSERYYDDKAKNSMK